MVFTFHHPVERASTLRPNHFGDIHRFPVVPYIPRTSTDPEGPFAKALTLSSPRDEDLDSTSLKMASPPHSARSSHTRRPMRPSPLNPNSHLSPETPSFAGLNLLDTPDPAEADDTLQDLRARHGPGVLATFAHLGGRNQSTTSVGSKAKADKVLGLDPHARLASFYLVSGVPRDFAEWSFADPDATRGMAQMDDSMGFFWRPDVLGSAYSGQKTQDWLKDLSRGRKGKSSSLHAFACPGGRPHRSAHVPDAGPDGPNKLLNKTLKYAHPRDVEVINSTLAPPTTCHSFSFTIPKHDTLAAIARTRMEIPNFDPTSSVPEESILDPTSSATGHTRNMSAATELAFHGVTLTVWTHAEPDKVAALRSIKENREKIKAGGLDSLRAQLMKRPADKMTTVKWRSGLPWGFSRQSDADYTGSETDGMSDSDHESVFRGRKYSVDEWPGDTAPVFEDGGDNFWTPYAITLVSRHPIYDVMQDYLRLSWSMYAKNAKYHMAQMCRILNRDTPRPGETFQLFVGNRSNEGVTIESVMPGALDFERGIVKVDFQLWPFFQALDLDHIITGAEVALSNSGRVMFFSKHPSMLNIAVSTLKYIVELRGWDGIAMPMLHCRDVTFVIEDPGPYIIGMTSECRYMVTIPSEVVIIDLDANSLTCRSLPTLVSTRPKPEKAKAKIMAAFGTGFPVERSIPIEFKISYPRGAFRNINRFLYGTQRPTYLGERLRPPQWWKHAEIITAFDKVLLNKHKKPSLIQRLTKAGVGRHEARLSVGEQLAKTMMRKRALHYVEARDDLERKVARINKRLIRMAAEGEHWRAQFESFEKYAEKLAVEASDLKNKIERERREAKRLSNIANEQTKANNDLEQRLKNTEDARAEAMRQLSDMHQSIQDLEKEREDIMNLFETQINSALSKGFPEDLSRASTPLGSVASSPKPRQGRPSTRDSAQTGLSRFTVESRPISVLGAARARPEGLSRGETEEERMIWERTDGIAARMASIQQKLEMALCNVSSHGHGVATTNVDDHTDEENEVDLTETYDASHKKSAESLRTAQAPSPLAPHPTITLDQMSPSSLDVQLSHSPRSTWTDAKVNELVDRRRYSATELGLIPRGVSLRIKRRPESVGEVREKLLVRRSRLARSASDGPTEHERMTSDSTFGEDSLVTPSASEVGGLLVSEDTADEDEVDIPDVKDKENRLSVASDTTLAFGV